MFFPATKKQEAHWLSFSACINNNQFKCPTFRDKSIIEVHSRFGVTFDGGFLFAIFSNRKTDPKNMTGWKTTQFLVDVSPWVDGDFPARKMLVNGVF